MSLFNQFSSPIEDRGNRTGISFPINGGRREDGAAAYINRRNCRINRGWLLVNSPCPGHCSTRIGTPVTPAPFRDNHRGRSHSPETVKYRLK